MGVVELESMELNTESFKALLEKLLGDVEQLQNNPPDLTPQEDLAVKHVLNVLQPLSTENGGPLIINHVTYVEKRGNLIIEYPGSETDKIVSFVGAHMDVVTANPEDWDFDPFKLTYDGDRLQGRGTTDCLGHVALITELMRQLGEKKPNLKSTVVAVFIANEENSSKLGIGIDELVKNGLLDKLKKGPLYWIDVADKQPCIATGGMLVWRLRATGKLFHSGLPDKAINALELCMDALKEIQLRFYEDFPPHERETEYKFATPSTMKPTQWDYTKGSVNQIPGECVINGDVRLTPFYDIKDVAKKIQEYVEYLNQNITTLESRGPVSKYTLPDENISGKLYVEFDDEMIPGVACNLDSPGFYALRDATKKVIGYCEPYSITGTLPLIKDLQDEGFDVQTVGYGLMDTYHAQNEYCLLSDFQLGFKVLCNVISILEESN